MELSLARAAHSMATSTRSWLATEGVDKSGAVGALVGKGAGEVAVAVAMAVMVREGAAAATGGDDGTT